MMKKKVWKYFLLGLVVSTILFTGCIMDSPDNIIIIKKNVTTSTINLIGNVTQNITNNITNNITSQDGNNYTLTINVTGTSIKILNLTRVGMVDLLAYFTDKDTQLSEAEVNAFVDKNGYFNNISNFTGSRVNNSICIYNSSVDLIECNYIDQVGSGGGAVGSNETLVDASECGDAACNTFILVMT